MVQPLSRKVSFGELSRANKVAYVLSIVFGVLFWGYGVIDAFGYLRLLQILQADGGLVDMPRWLTSMISFIASFICLLVLPDIIKSGSADRIQERIIELVKKGKVIIFPRSNTKH